MFYRRSREAGIAEEPTNFRAAYIMADLESSRLNIEHFPSVSSPSLWLAERDPQSYSTGFQPAFHGCSTVDAADLI
jgi:hypothetical protein